MAIARYRASATPTHWRKRCLSLAAGKADGLATDYVKVRRALAGSSDDGGAVSALEEWIATRSEAEASLIWEALSRPVRVYRDLSQAVDELVAMASAL